MRAHICVEKTEKPHYWHHSLGFLYVYQYVNGSVMTENDTTIKVLCSNLLT